MAILFKNYLFHFDDPSPMGLMLVIMGPVFGGGRTFKIRTICTKGMNVYPMNASTQVCFIVIWLV